MRDGNDFLAMGNGPGLDAYEIGELEPSWSKQLDTVGMQPHSREYLEQEVLCERSWRKFQMMGGQMVDYPKGIQFSGCP